MLVLSRRKGETIVIQDNIEITVLAVEGETVRLGISAPKEIDIFRKEVHAAIKEANRDSAAPSASDISSLLEQMRSKRMKS